MGSIPRYNRWPQDIEGDRIELISYEEAPQHHDCRYRTMASRRPGQWKRLQLSTGAHDPRRGIKRTQESAPECANHALWEALKYRIDAAPFFPGRELRPSEHLK